MEAFIDEFGSKWSSLASASFSSSLAMAASLLDVDHYGLVPLLVAESNSVASLIICQAFLACMPNRASSRVCLSRWIEMVFPLENI